MFGFLAFAFAFLLVADFLVGTLGALAGPHFELAIGALEHVQRAQHRPQFILALVSRDREIAVALGEAGHPLRDLANLVREIA